MFGKHDVILSIVPYRAFEYQVLVIILSFMAVMVLAKTVPLICNCTSSKLLDKKSCTLLKVGLRF